MKAYTDESKMPFGKHKGEPLMDVPASYFHWLWHQEDFDRSSPMGLYIKENIAALKMEDKDKIWHI